MPIDSSLRSRGLMEVDVCDGEGSTRRQTRRILGYEPPKVYGLDNPSAYFPIPDAFTDEEVRWIVGREVPLIIVMWRSRYAQGYTEDFSP